MHTVRQMNPELYREVVRRQAEFWDAVVAAFAEALGGVFELRWTLDTRPSIEDVLADLAYGRE
jgi:hypothetical protein